MKSFIYQIISYVMKKIICNEMKLYEIKWNHVISGTYISTSLPSRKYTCKISHVKADKLKSQLDSWMHNARVYIHASI